MTLVERLQAAIENLERLKAESTPGPWHHGPEAGDIEVYSGWSDPERPNSEVVILPRVRPRGGWGRGVKIYDGNYEPNAELIVTLHRTIDAQIAWLYYAVELERTVQPPADFRNYALRLADAILGSET